MSKKNCCSVYISKLAGKNLWNSYLIKWSDGEKEQDKQEEDEAAAGCSHTEEKNALQNQKRKFVVMTVCKYFFLSI